MVPVSSHGASIRLLPVNQTVVHSAMSKCVCYQRLCVSPASRSLQDGG